MYREKLEDSGMKKKKENKVNIEEVKRKNIKELFVDYKGDYKSMEIEWGKPEGKELW